MKLDKRPTPKPIRGFRFAGIHGGIKNRGRRDFALIVADRPAVCAAMFTKNIAAAAPVQVARRHVEGGRIQAVMVNSGNANAATGDKGLKFVEWSCRQLASQLSVEPELVLPCSTGVIGVQLERTPYARAISLGVESLSKNGFGAAARAIMTSDAFPKWTSRKVGVGNEEVVIAGMAKGAGMIHPNMATMLAYLVTDAEISTELATLVLRGAVEKTFNRSSVDGDTSTNDTVVLLASGCAGGGPIEANSRRYEAFAEAVEKVCDELARMIVRDGEGATKIVDLVVEGLTDNEQAECIVASIARSLLVKTAFTGADPNWGRLLAAAGAAGVPFDADGFAVRIGDVEVARDGEGLGGDARKAARRVMRGDAFTVTVQLGKGPGRAHRVTSDLTTEYVVFNSAYTS